MTLNIDSLQGSDCYTAITRTELETEMLKAARDTTGLLEEADLHGDSGMAQPFEREFMVWYQGTNDTYLPYFRLVTMDLPFNKWVTTIYCLRLSEQGEEVVMRQSFECHTYTVFNQTLYQFLSTMISGYIVAEGSRK